MTDEEFQALGKAKIAEGVEAANKAFNALCDAAYAASVAFNNPNFLGGTPAELSDVAHIVPTINSQINMVLQSRQMQEQLRAQVNGTVNIGV